MIRGYSKIVGIAVLIARACAITLDVIGAQGNRITAPTRKMNVSNDCDTEVTWNSPLKIPTPDPIAWIYIALNDNAAE